MGVKLKVFSKNFHEKYKHMSLAQKEDCHRRIAQLVDVEIPLTLKPNIQPHKGRFKEKEGRLLYHSSSLS